MNINIFEEKVINIEDILAIKSYLKRLDSYNIKEDSLNGMIKIDLTYLDHNMTENFKTLDLEFDVILKDGMTINEVILQDLDLYIIENKGVNIKYNIDIDYDMSYELDELTEDKEDEIIEIPVLIEEDKNEDIIDLDENDKDKEVINEELLNEKTPEDEIQNEYQKMLGEVILKREDNVNIIEVKENNEDDFLSLFDSFEKTHLKITKVLVTSKEEIMNKYSITEEVFNKSYDESTNTLTLRSYE